jgi:hypothetical protein
MGRNPSMSPQTATSATQPEHPPSLLEGDATSLEVAYDGLLGNEAHPTGRAVGVATLLGGTEGWPNDEVPLVPG